jgi:hypothetical protein
MPRHSFALLLLVSSIAACASPPPARRDVVIGIVGEPSSVFADDPGARVIAAAVTEPLVTLDAAASSCRASRRKCPRSRTAVCAS